MSAICPICDILFRYDTNSHFSWKNIKGEDRSSWKAKELIIHSDWQRLYKTIITKLFTSRALKRGWGSQLYPETSSFL